MQTVLSKVEGIGCHKEDLVWQSSLGVKVQLSLNLSFWWRPSSTDRKLQLVNQLKALCQCIIRVHRQWVRVEDVDGPHRIRGIRYTRSQHVDAYLPLRVCPKRTMKHGSHTSMPSVQHLGVHLGISGHVYNLEVIGDEEIRWCTHPDAGANVSLQRETEDEDCSCFLLHARSPERRHRVQRRIQLVIAVHLLLENSDPSRQPKSTNVV
mmetsp:Transcript_89779/g.155398  ORF Transcript_89779/g.155398 Transcript_89779/m.155398 type:complete len:208 (-) Transcript_89779:7949-8572(-)